MLDDDALGDLGAGADETVVFDDDRIRLQRLKDAADAGAAGNMAILADLRATADGGPGVDHGARVHVGAQVDETGHQDDAGRDVGRVADDAMGHGAETGLAEPGLVPALELGRHLVEPVGAAGAAGEGRHVVEPERQQNRLFKPLVDPPAAAGLLGHPGLAGIQQFKRGIDGVANLTGGVDTDGLAVLPGAVDGRLQGGRAHGFPSLAVKKPSKRRQKMRHPGQGVNMNRGKGT